MDYFRQNKAGLLIIGVVGVLVFCITVVTLLIANSWNQDTPVTKSDFSIELTRGVCFGFCPAYTVAIDGNGQVRFTGQTYTTVDGETVEYSIDKTEVSKLISAVDDMDFFSLKERYEDPYITDLPSMEIKVTAEGKTKSIYVYGIVGTDYPKQLDALAELIDEVGQTNAYANRAVDLPLDVTEPDPQ